MAIHIITAVHNPCCYRKKLGLKKLQCITRKRVHIPRRQRSSSESLQSRTQKQKSKAGTKPRLNRGKIDEIAVDENREQTLRGDWHHNKTISEQILSKPTTLSSGAALNYLLLCEALPTEDSMYTIICPRNLWEPLVNDAAKKCLYTVCNFRFRLLPQLCFYCPEEAPILAL